MVERVPHGAGLDCRPEKERHREQRDHDSHDEESDQPSPKRAQTAGKNFPAARARGRGKFPEDESPDEQVENENPGNQQSRGEHASEQVGHGNRHELKAFRQRADLAEELATAVRQPDPHGRRAVAQLLDRVRRQRRALFARRSVRRVRGEKRPDALFALDVGGRSEDQPPVDLDARREGIPRRPVRDLELDASPGRAAVAESDRAVKDRDPMTVDPRFRRSRVRGGHLRLGDEREPAARDAGRIEDFVGHQRGLPELLFRLPPEPVGEIGDVGPIDLCWKLGREVGSRETISREMGCEDGAGGDSRWVGQPDGRGAPIRVPRAVLLVQRRGCQHDEQRRSDEKARRSESLRGSGLSDGPGP